MKKLIFFLFAFAPILFVAQNGSDVPLMSIDKPDNWFEESDIDLSNNLKRYEMDRSEFNEILKTHRGSITTNVFMKYDVKKHPGVIPTIQINLRPNPTENIEQFEASIIGSRKQMESLLEEFTVIEKTKRVFIGGKEAIYFLASFKMTLPNGEVETIRSWSYAIPVGNFFYQVNLSDLFEKDDCSSIYKELIENIEFR